MRQLARLTGAFVSAPSQPSDRYHIRHMSVIVYVYLPAHKGAHAARTQSTFSRESILVIRLISEPTVKMKLTFGLCSSCRSKGCYNETGFHICDNKSASASIVSSIFVFGDKIRYQSLPYAETVISPMLLNISPRFLWHPIHQVI
jgi:hypothetical protein